MLSPRLTLRFLTIVSIALTAEIFVAGHCASAQDSGDARLPAAAKLALRAKPGDTIKMEGTRKVTTHIHLEALLSEFSTETAVKDDSTYQFRGRGPNGTLQVEVRNTARISGTNGAGQAVKPKIIRQAALCTVRPNLEVIKAIPLTAVSGSKPGGRSNVASSTAVSSQSFGAIRLPDKTLKPGDAWSGKLPITQEDDLKGITLNYQATLIGFEMYQNFPCAHVEVNYSYKGPLPAIEAQIRKSLPKGSKLTSDGQLTGTETAYYVLDRGWPLNDQVKLSIALNIGITANDHTLDVGGTIDVDDHSAVNAYPPYEPSMVPLVGPSSPN